MPDPMPDPLVLGSCGKPPTGHARWPWKHVRPPSWAASCAPLKLIDGFGATKNACLCFDCPSLLTLLSACLLIRELPFRAAVFLLFPFCTLFLLNTAALPL